MMKKYELDDFKSNNGWLIFRMDGFLKDGVIDIYVVMDLPSGMLLAHEITQTELSQKQVTALLEQALLFTKGKAPKQIVLADNDPVEPFLKKSAKKLEVGVKIVPAVCLENLTKEVKLRFYKGFGDPINDDVESECEDPRQLLPDSYDLCPCASGLKYKFCCKRILAEVVEAMVAAEDGDFKKALESIEKARKLVGDTSEVLCRESIVYSFFDPEKGKELLKKCLAVNPKHPRAHYLQALDLTALGDLDGAIKAYETAISYYPKTDHYHLNETHNNLGRTYYLMGDYAKAKAEWELALKLLPSDKIARQNLQNFIGVNKKASCKI